MPIAPGPFHQTQVGNTHAFGHEADVADLDLRFIGVLLTSLTLHFIFFAVEKLGSL